LFFFDEGLSLFNIEQQLKFVLKKPQKTLDQDVHFRVLHLLETKPHLTQRELASELGISLGGVNYCLKALIDIGHIKVKNFSQHPRKIAYMYLLTPEGVASKLRLTAGFLKRKMDEYQALKKEIESIKLSLRD
jgi:EPS-associated MarR family transcriptional regulator